MIQGIFARHPEITSASLFGSRAKGIASPSSDIDIVLDGIDEPLKAESIASELDELPLPCRFHVKARSAIEYQPLREHIERDSVQI